MHKGDPHNHDKSPVSVYLINTATNEFLFAGNVKHMKLLKFEVESELYQLRVAYDWQQQDGRNAASQEEEELKHIAINIDIDPIVANEEEAPRDEKAAS
jgi:hypothetical protein